jgi:hypothetical protein
VPVSGIRLAALELVKDGSGRESTIRATHVLASPEPTQARTVAWSDGQLEKAAQRLTKIGRSSLVLRSDAPAANDDWNDGVDASLDL